MRASVIHLALFAALAAFAHAEIPSATAEGRLVGAYQDNIDASFVCLVVERDGKFNYAFIKTNDTASVLKDLQPLVGRHVSVSGYEKMPIAPNRVFTKLQIMIQSLADVKIASGKDYDPFAAATLDDAPPSFDELSVSSPRKASGTVTARWQNKVMLQTASGESLIAELRDGIDLPAIGESVEAAGTPVTDLYRIHLAEAVWRKSSEPPAKPESPSTVTLEMLFKSKSGGEFIMNPKFFGHTLKVTGALREFVTDEDGGKRLLVENGGHTIQIDCSNAPEASKTELGSQISATGVCVLDSDFWRPTLPFPKNNSLFLVARSPDDIVVLKRPPWWTPAKFLIAASVMAGIIVMILIWNASLRVLVERKSREVIKAQARKLESELRIAERTRLAADLHDSLSQNLTVIGYQVSTAKNTLGGKDPATTGCLDTAAKMIRSCRTDLRRCLWDLRSDVLDETNFAEAIRKTVAPVAGSASVAVRFEGPRAVISDSTAHGVLNAVRELVANAVRHGGAKKIRIAGEVKTGVLNLSVRDDGCGFDPGRRPGQTEGHFGLDGIAERIERLGGTFEIESSPGKGTYAVISFSKKP
jgi:signal transduction histidine kinase